MAETEQQQEMSKSERDLQMARDLQLAYELEAEGLHSIQNNLLAANGTNDVASNTNILGGARSSAAATSPFGRMSNLFSSRTRNNNNNNSSYYDDGSANMNTNGSLLYVPCEIKGRMVEMMVDSGSQTSVISSTMMHKLKLTKRLNTRYQGVAAGVGAAPIMGRIENCAVTLGGGVEFNLYFLVIDVPHDMLILGVDQMRRFNCLIDLQNNLLVFGGHGGVEVPFLPPDPEHVDAREQCTIS